jgi:hypothetical protein
VVNDPIIFSIFELYICMYGHLWHSPTNTHTYVSLAGPRGKSKGIAKVRNNAGGKEYRQHRQPAAETVKWSKSDKQVARDEDTGPHDSKDGAAASTPVEPEPVLIHEYMNTFAKKTSITLICNCALTHDLAHARMCARTYVRSHARARARAHTHTHTHAHTHTHTHAHTRTHTTHTTHTHTHTHTLTRSRAHTLISPASSNQTVLLSDEEHAALQATKQEIKGLLSSLAHKNAELSKLAAGV